MRDFIRMMTNRSAIIVTVILVSITYISTVRIEPKQNEFVQNNESSVAINK